MNPLPFILLAVSLPLLLGGCGEKEEPVAETKPEEPVVETKPELEGVNAEELEERESIWYLKDSETPYTGKVYSLHPNGQKELEGNFKDGKMLFRKRWDKKGELVDLWEKSVKSDLKYKIIDDAVTITGLNSSASGKLIIPATIESKPVTSIGNGAFSRCTSLTSVTIPEVVTSIGTDAFADCTSLTSITIPDGVTSIGYWTFQRCRNLTNITIGDSVTSIGNWAFSECTSLTSITIPDSVTSIGSYAFLDCTSLTSIIIAEGVTDIGNRAFKGCASLTAVTLLGDAPRLGLNTFRGVTPTIYRKPEAKGWGETFGGRPVKLISEKP